MDTYRIEWKPSALRELKRLDRQVVPRIVTAIEQLTANPLPDDSASLEEIAEFWDTHDTTDYHEAFRTVDATFDIQRRHYEIEVQEDIFEVLTKKSQSLNVPVERFVDRVLRRELVH